MHIVAAGVHDADLVAVLVAHADLAGVRQAGLFDDRQGVHVGADHYGRAGAVLEDRDDAVSAHICRDLKSRLTQFIGHMGGRPHLHERQFGVRVQVGIEGFETRKLGVNCRANGGRPGGYFRLRRGIIVPRDKVGGQKKGHNGGRQLTAIHRGILAGGRNSGIIRGRGRYHPNVQTPGQSRTRKKMFFPSKLRAAWIYLCEGNWSSSSRGGRIGRRCPVPRAGRQVPRRVDPPAVHRIRGDAPIMFRSAPARWHGAGSTDPRLEFRTPSPRRRTGVVDRTYYWCPRYARKECFPCVPSV